MAETASTMHDLGTEAPDFSLSDTDGVIVNRRDFAQRPLLVMFLSNHCPYVKHVRPVIAAVGDDYADSVAVVAIMSNDVDCYPDDHPDRMAEEKAAHGYGFPYLYDESQEVAKAYRAACTPDIYVFDADHRLVYRGQLDDARPSNGVDPTGRDLRDALDAVLAGDAPSVEQRPSLGCNIKWKPGNEPDYF